MFSYVLVAEYLGIDAKKDTNASMTKVNEKTVELEKLLSDVNGLAGKITKAYELKMAVQIIDKLKSNFPYPSKPSIAQLYDMYFLHYMEQCISYAYANTPSLKDSKASNPKLQASALLEAFPKFCNAIYHLRRTSTTSIYSSAGESGNFRRTDFDALKFRLSVNIPDVAFDIILAPPTQLDLFPLFKKESSTNVYKFSFFKTFFWKELYTADLEPLNPARK